MKNFISTENAEYNLKIATIEDAQLIITFMKKLGTYQKMEEAITATPERIKRLLKDKLGEAIFGIYKEKIISFAYFHQKSSAFSGRKGLYIDAFFIDECVRGKGLGKIMFQYLSKYAIDRECEYLEWVCLGWNKQAIKFYERQGSYCVDNLKIYRLSPDNLSLNAKKFTQN
ncbi:GNAT family N-acetyltransferase [Arcobacter sp. CECT 8983]|uniref:GNAT family N-acetyltransferase n=1 Tax=Arcobacter sp. CECT 8983 TaxID=2044508 RepID=UPI00100BAF35|nr:GNAT family N-acetyltransferase [Arcobacter sp. CECT 8983]RXJ88620.1 GNAT family N-acetyltransferase [Arcobacter sp. CECT 8983]